MMARNNSNIVGRNENDGRTIIMDNETDEKNDIEDSNWEYWSDVYSGIEPSPCPNDIPEPSLSQILSGEKLQKTKIMISNLPHPINEIDIKQILEERLGASTVMRVYMTGGKNAANRLHNGGLKAIAEFYLAQHAQAAIDEFNNVKVKGQMLRVTFKPSYGPGGGGNYGGNNHQDDYYDNHQATSNNHHYQLSLKNNKPGNNKQSPKNDKLLPKPKPSSAKLPELPDPKLPEADKELQQITISLPKPGLFSFAHLSEEEEAQTKDMTRIKPPQQSVNVSDISNPPKSNTANYYSNTKQATSLVSATDPKTAGAIPGSSDGERGSSQSANSSNSASEQRTLQTRQPENYSANFMGGGQKKEGMVLRAANQVDPRNEGKAMVMREFVEEVICLLRRQGPIWYGDKRLQRLIQRSSLAVQTNLNTWLLGVLRSLPGLSVIGPFVCLPMQEIKATLMCAQKRVKSEAKEVWEPFSATQIRSLTQFWEYMVQMLGQFGPLWIWDSRVEVVRRAYPDVWELPLYVFNESGLNYDILIINDTLYLLSLPQHRSAIH